MRFIFSLLAVTFCVTLSCENHHLEKKSFFLIRPDASKILLSVEIAQKDEDLQRGFMYRKHIPEGTGMLFVFEKDQMLSFWMKNTFVPLSIAYIDSQGVIREIFDMQPLSLDSVQSSGLVRYALEVPQGWFAKNNIVPLSRLDISVLKK